LLSSTSLQQVTGSVFCILTGPNRYFFCLCECYSEYIYTLINNNDAYFITEIEMFSSTFDWNAIRYFIIIKI
jgi:hypothetical protein